VRASRSCIALAVLVGLAGPASAGAATQIGETFNTEIIGCTGNTYLQTGSTGPQYSVPFDGVITSWSHQGNSNPSELKLKVARRVGVDSFTVIGESALKTAAANQLNTFSDVQIPVRSGDVIGIYMATGNSCGRQPPGEWAYHIAPGDVPPGPPMAFTPSTTVQLNISATVEPDCDSDALGDESQDPSVLGGDCPIRGRGLTLDANKNKVKKGKKVRFTGRLTEVLRQGECQSAQTVELQRKRPSQTAFTTVEQLQTDAAGNFSARKKVKKTFEYRAQVAETPTCANGTSNTEKVKVKKK
jgi:hypothetical protein